MSEQGNMPNMTWNSANYGFEIKSNEPGYFFNSSWDDSVDHNDPFVSALSSMVSSPTVGIPTCGSGVGEGDGKSIVLSELIGKLGGISNNIGDISSHSSCYSTPLNSPPKHSSLTTMVDHQIKGGFSIPNRNIPSSHQISIPFSPDLGFAERAARFSSFSSNFNGNRPFGSNGNEFCQKLTPKLEPVSQSGKIGGSSAPETAEFVDSREGSSVSYQISGGESANARKRKPAPKGKSKDSNHNPPSSSSAPSKDAKMGEEHDESNGKRSKANEAINEKEEANENKNNSKPPEPSSTKDYIHVRARRGQATDSHSLAERVRREKISERMKFLQDLVPGCNKVTGKAVMLDEIINYVQSLQKQVEFLSMKLSTLNPRMELNLETILSKDIFQSRTSMGQNLYPFEPAYGTTMNTFSVESLNNVSIHQNTSLQVPPVENQAATYWDDDELHSIVKMSFGENLFQNSQY